MTKFCLGFSLAGDDVLLWGSPIWVKNSDFLKRLETRLHVVQSPKVSGYLVSYMYIISNSSCHDTIPLEITYMYVYNPQMSARRAQSLPGHRVLQLKNQFYKGIENSHFLASTSIFKFLADYIRPLIQLLVLHCLKSIWYVLHVSKPEFQWSTSDFR